MSFLDSLEEMGLPIEASKSGLKIRDIIILVSKAQMLGVEEEIKKPIFWNIVKTKGSEMALSDLIRKKFKMPTDIFPKINTKQMLNLLAYFQSIGISPENKDAWEDYEKILKKQMTKKQFVDKWINKTANIRGETVRPCPFGLPVPDACNNVGDLIFELIPSEEQDVISENNIKYAYFKECKRCPFADGILKEFEKVDCDFGDNAAGTKSVNFRGSPIYPQVFSGPNLDGKYDNPVGYYSDYDRSRNLFYGLYSLVGNADIDSIIKLANYYDIINDFESKKIIDNLLNKLYSNKEEDENGFNKIANYLNNRK